MDGQWTVVRYGRRRRRFARADGGRGGGRAVGWMDRAPPTSSGWKRWGPNPPPNKPVPPPWFPRYFGPQSRSFASVVRGRQYDARPAPWLATPGVVQSDGIRRQPADPQFGRLVRKFHMLIKMAHHLQNVTPQEGSAEPRMITRMVDILSSMIKPAAPTPRTVDMVRGNATNWGYNTVTILMDHYKAGIGTILKELPALMIPDWKSAFQVAVRWARRNIPRVSQGVVDHVEALVVAEVTSGGQQQQQADLSVPRDKGSTTREAQQQTDNTNRVQPHVEDLVVKPGMQTTATMTDVSTPTRVEQAPLETSPREQRLGHRVRKARGVILKDDGDLQAEVEEGSDDWRVVETPDPDSTHLALAQMFDELDAEQEREMLESQVSPIPPSQGVGAPNSGVIQFHQEADPEEEDLFEDSADHFTSPEPRFQVRRHINTQRKLTDWDLVVSKKFLIIGDSNLSKIPDFLYRDLQVESFPGGHFRHAQALMEKTWPPQGLVVEKVVLSFGMNSRANKSRETSIKNLQGAIRAAKRKFPYAEIWVPLINFSSELPEEERENLQILNDHMERNMGFIPLLPDDQFTTEADDVHWTEETARTMLDHWVKFLNSVTP